MTDPAPIPALGLLMGLRRPPQWEPLVQALSKWCRPHYADGTGPAPAAWLASSPEVDGLAPALAGTSPVAVLSADPGVAGPGGGRPDRPAVAAIVWTDPTVGGSAADAGAAGDGPVVRLSSVAVDGSSCWPVTPYVRGRWRAARGLPPDLVIDAAAVPDDVRPSALALAAAVIAVDPGHLVEALAWGAPCVTSAGTARAVGARDGVHVIVDPTPEGASIGTLAARLAADIRTAAELGRAGRRLVETLHDYDTAAREVARRLGLPLGDSLDRRLDELRTPSDAAVRARAAAAR